MNKAWIDDQPFAFHSGESILDFVRRCQAEPSIPTLCDLPQLESFGSCRVCSVEVLHPRSNNLQVVASCHTPVTEGLKIYTSGPKIQKLRKNIIELVLTDHPLDCLTCEVNNNCELQTVAAEVGIRDVRYPQGENHLQREKDESHPYMRSELSKCINCYRCVRACDEIQGQFVLNMMGRGFDSHIIKGDDESFLDSDCVSCGACAQACPTSAISDVFQSKAKTSHRKTQTICTYCGVGCNLQVSSTGNEIISIQAVADAEVNQGHTCLKGRYAFQFYNHPDRLRSPMIRVNGELQDVSWDQAYEHMVNKLNEIKHKHGPTSIAGISSARTTNEENYLMQKFIRSVIGTNNIDCCARVCHSPTAIGMQRTFGTGAATNSIEDIKHTDCILVIGANPTESHPVTGAKLKQFAMKGKPSIVIDPRKTELARYASHHIQLRPGTNVAVLNMMMHVIVSEKLYDAEFVHQRTEGFDDYCKHLQEIDIVKLETVSGVSYHQIQEAARAYAQADRAMSFHGLGVTEHSQGTFAVMQIAELAMLTGNIGKPGVGVNPLRGQNNVQGAADMGAQPYQGAGYLSVYEPENIQLYSDFYQTPAPTDKGFTIPEMFNKSLEGDLKALWIIGEDVVQTDPNSKKVQRALKALDLLVVQELFMTETAKLADVVLPGASFFEKSGTFTNGERRIQRVNQVIEPLQGCKSDGQIIVDVMNRMGHPHRPYDPQWVLEEISQIVPFFAGVKWQELGVNGKQWPVAKNGVDSQIIHQQSFKRGLGHFEFHPFEESNEINTHHQNYPYILTTNRDLEHYNCGTMTRRTQNIDLNKEDVLLIHPEDASEHAIADGDWVCVESARGKIDIRAELTDEVKPGILSSTFHFPEIMMNDLTSDEHDSESYCPEYKVVSVKIRKSKGRIKHELQQSHG